jgi:hypothetical protein
MPVTKTFADNVKEKTSNISSIKKGFFVTLYIPDVSLPCHVV